MSGVDEALRQHSYLSEGLARLYRGARANPLSEENLRVGLIEAGDTRKTAEQKIEERIQEVRERLSALAFFDMCSAFEAECRKRIPTAVGEANRVIDRHYQVKPLKAVKQSLVKNAKDFESLDAISRLLEGKIANEQMATFKAIRETRNAIAHGVISRERERLDLVKLSEFLDNLLRFLFPNGT